VNHKGGGARNHDPETREIDAVVSAIAAAAIVSVTAATAVSPAILGNIYGALSDEERREEIIFWFCFPFPGHYCCKSGLVGSGKGPDHVRD
jgi:hypothetical protein